MAGIEKVVLVQRLREVMALVGFTRFEAAGPDTEGELDINVRRAELARNLTWVPAVENRGEGIFVQFRKADIEVCAQRPSVSQRSMQLLQGFEAWKAEHEGSNRKFPEPAYLLLHSIAHLLITTISLECGYPASSIRERVYAIPDLGYGILLYTGGSDAEGTLGGLVEVGRRIADILRSALELEQNHNYCAQRSESGCGRSLRNGRVSDCSSGYTYCDSAIGARCSNDPVCAQHDAGSLNERRFLLGAACHGCLLVAETSCEQQNEMLARALLVSTVHSQGAEFFSATPT